jgi:hypothetical protein
MRACCSALVLAALALPPFALAQGTAPHRAVEDILPASSYACFRFGGLAEYRKAVDQMPAAELVKDLFAKLPPAAGQQVTSGLDNAAGQVRSALGRTGLRPAAVRAVLQRPMALGIGRPTLRGFGLSVALVIDTGPARNDLGEVFAALEQLAQHLDANMKTGHETIAGFDLHTIEPHDGPKILHGFAGDFYVLTNSTGYLAEIAAVAKGQAPALSSSSSLATARARLPMQALASAFANLRPFRSMLDPVLPYEAAEIGALLGVDGCDGIYWGTSGAQAGAADVLHLGMTGPTQGLLKTAFKGPVSLAAARYCSPEAVAFAAGSLDIPAVVDAFGRCLDALPESMREELRREIGRDLGRELRHFGLTPQALDGMLRAFGSNVALDVDLAKGTPLPELLLFVEVKDMQQVGPLLAHMEQAIAQQTGNEWKVRKAGNREIRYCNAAVPMLPSPCWVQDGNMLLFSSNVKSLMAALSRADKSEPSLAAADDFRELAASCKDAACVLHLRLRTGAELGWKAAEPFLRSLIDAHQDRLGVSGDVVPDAEQVARAAGTTTISLHVDQHGVLFRQSGSLALGALFATAGRLCDEVLERASAKVF